MPALRRAAGLLSALLLLWVLGVPTAFADTSSLTLTDARLTTPVALATDHDHSLYWTASSAADKHTSVFALGADGRVVAVLTYPQATKGVLAVGYAANTLYVLDKGSTANGLRLSYLTLSNVVVSGSLPYHLYGLVLPESGQVAVALIVAPHSQLSVVAASGRVYRAPAKPVVSASNKLTKVATMTADVTGGYYDAAQTAVVLRTADSIVVTDPTSLAIRSTLHVAAAAGGRGVTDGLDGQSYLLGQGKGTTIVSVALSGVSPSPSASPTGSPSSSSTPDPVSGTPPTSPGLSGELLGNGTRLALVGALVLALLAGLVAARR